MGRTFTAVEGRKLPMYWYPMRVVRDHRDGTAKVLILFNGASAAIPLGTCLLHRTGGTATALVPNTFQQPSAGNAPRRQPKTATLGAAVPAATGRATATALRVLSFHRPVDTSLTKAACTWLLRHSA